ncbi:MAG: hypothetical protein ACO3Q6_05685 [Ilumatobacteraceae bacterium]
MGVEYTPFATDTKVVQLFEREKANETEITIYRNGGKVHVISGTYTLIKPDGTKLIDAQPVTISGNSAFYTLTASDLDSTLVFGEGYIENWCLVLDQHSDHDHDFRRMAAVVRRRLYPTVYDGDLTAIYSDLADLRPSTLTSYQQYIDDAWWQMMRRLRIEAGGYEYLILSSEVFFDAHRHFTLYLIWRDFHSSLGQSNGRYMDLAQEHYRLYQDEWKRINFVYDYDNDGKADDANQRSAKQPVIYTASPGSRGRFRWYGRGRY